MEVRLPPSLEQAKRMYPPIWVVYDRPQDFPGLIVARVWYGEVASDDVLVGGDLEETRNKIISAGGSYRLPRDDEDAPHIVECWI